MSAPRRYVPVSPDPSVGFWRDAGPGPLFWRAPERPCYGWRWVGTGEGLLCTLPLVCTEFNGGLLF